MPFGALRCAWALLPGRSGSFLFSWLVSFPRPLLGLLRVLASLLVLLSGVLAGLGVLLAVRSFCGRRFRFVSSAVSAPLCRLCLLLLLLLLRGALLLLASLVPGLSWLRLPAALRSRLRLRRLCGVACLALRCSSGALRVLMRLCGRLSLAVGSSLWLALAVVSLLPGLPRLSALWLPAPLRCCSLLRGALARRVWFRRLGRGPASVAWVPALGPARRLRRGLGWPSGSCFPLGSFPRPLGGLGRSSGVGGCWVLARFRGRCFSGPFPPKNNPKPKPKPQFLLNYQQKKGRTLRHVPREYQPKNHSMIIRMKKR